MSNAERYWFSYTFAWLILNGPENSLLSEKQFKTRAVFWELVYLQEGIPKLNSREQFGALLNSS